MSISKAVGRLVLVGLVIFLFIKGALVLRPKETMAALSALIAALVHACCGPSTNSSSAQNGAALEERREGELVRHRQGDQRGEGDVHPSVLDHAEVLRMQAGQFGGFFLRQLALFPELPKSESETLLSGSYRLLEGRAKSDL